MIAESRALDRRVRVRVSGTVQGVGFRPYVHRLATELGLSGFVLNDQRGVVLEVEGPAPAVDAFLARLPAQAPALAEVERVRAEDVPVEAGSDAGFAILGSAATGEPAALVSPDTAPCEDCLAELRDPADRRYRYPFINCTNCGPRFTHRARGPLRPAATPRWRASRCARPARRSTTIRRDRRFHAQPNACPVCGPSLRLLGPAEAAEGADPVARPPRRCCGRARSSPSRASAATTSRASRTTRRPWPRCARASTARSEPFALMAQDLAAVEALVELSRGERARCCARPGARSCWRRGAMAPPSPRPWRRARRTSA